MTSNAWLKFLLWILLIYPFILLYQYIAGARWEVVGGTLFESQSQVCMLTHSQAPLP